MTSMLCQKQPGGQVRVHDGELVEDLIVDSHGHITTTVSLSYCLQHISNLSLKLMTGNKISKP